MNYLNEDLLPGTPGALVENVGQLWGRIIARALEPGGIDKWAEATPVAGSTAVRLAPLDGSRPRILVAVAVSDGIRIICREAAGGVDGETLVHLAEAERSRRVGDMSPRSAAQIVQVALFGEVRYS